MRPKLYFDCSKHCLDDPSCEGYAAPLRSPPHHPLDYNAVFLCAARYRNGNCNLSPRFYWGETGNVLTTPLFKIPIPSSRSLVPTGYGYVLPDQNGWSRYLHFQSAWIVVLTGLLYVISAFFTGHLRKDLLPGKSDLSWRSFSNTIASHLRFARLSEAEAWSYNVLQRLSYLFVIFVLFPLIIWTGLAMSPAFVSAFPITVTSLGGQQSARTIHFFVTIALVLFLLVHVVMICVAGFKSRMRAMITGKMTTGQVITEEVTTDLADTHTEQT